MSQPSFRKDTSAASKRRRLDTLFRDQIRARDQDCQVPGNHWGRLEVAHFYPRRHLSVRWDLENAALLCAYHHQHLDTHEPLKWGWIASRLGDERLEALSRRRDVPWHKDYDVLLAGMPRSTGRGDAEL